MYWDNVAGVYDLFERIYNKECFDGVGERVAREIAPEDDVLECACGTGSISVQVAPVCRRLTVTDFSKGMLRQAEKNLSGFDNVRIRRADITSLKCPDGSFDKVIAGNVIHLLDDPRKAIGELLRVCKPGGRVIIPTYINKEKCGKTSLLIKLIGFAGANFTRQFSAESYCDFFTACGYEPEFDLVDGRMPCAIAVITKGQEVIA